MDSPTIYLISFIVKFVKYYFKYMRVNIYIYLSNLSQQICHLNLNVKTTRAKLVARNEKVFRNSFKSRQSD